MIITASHCSPTKFQTDVGFTIYQKPGAGLNVLTVPVAEEIYDPTYGQAGFNCLVPPGWVTSCRAADAAAYEWTNDSVPFTPYLMAQTQGYPTVPPGIPADTFGSRDVNTSTPTFTVTDAAVSYSQIWVGMTVNKMGDRTGWTRGEILQCSDGTDPTNQMVDCNVIYNPSSTCFNYRLDLNPDPAMAG